MKGLTCAERLARQAMEDRRPLMGPTPPPLPLPPGPLRDLHRSEAAEAAALGRLAAFYGADRDSEA